MGGVLARLQRDEGVEVLLPHERLLLAQQVPTLRAVYASARRATLTLAYRVRLGARDLGPGGRAPQHGEDAVDQLEVHGDKGEHAEQLLRVGEAEEFVAEDGAAGAHGVEEEEELGDGAEQEEVGLGVGGGGGENAMLVLVDSSVKVDFYVRDVPEVVWDLIDLADKPLTIIYSGARNLAANLLAEDGSVGIRVTNEDFSKRLCQQFRKAIVSTSANISGQPSPKNFSEISEEVKSAVDYIVGYRQEEMSNPKPSSIIKLDKGGVIKIIRE